MREAAQGGGEMAPPELVRTFYETVVSQHRLEDLPRFVGEGCVLRQGEWTTPLGPGGMVRHLAALRETYPDYTVRILRQHCKPQFIRTQAGEYSKRRFGADSIHRKQHAEHLQIILSQEAKKAQVILPHLKVRVNLALFSGPQPLFQRCRRHQNLIADPVIFQKDLIFLQIHHGSFYISNHNLLCQPGSSTVIQSLGQFSTQVLQPVHFV